MSEVSFCRFETVKTDNNDISDTRFLNYVIEISFDYVDL